jgi:iron complex outermembrane receptor protein
MCIEPRLHRHFTINLGERTSLNLYYEYYEDNRDPFTFVTFALSDGSFLPRSLYAGYPISFAYRAAERYGYELQHDFSDNWQIRNNLAVFEAYNRQLDPATVPPQNDQAIALYTRYATLI